jgi:hypothetical protein
MDLDPDKEAILQLQEALARVRRELPASEERKRPTREEILERKISMARERGSRVLRINSPLGNIMFNVLRQFDMAYGNFKGQLGEPGGITYEEGAQIMDEAREITMAFSKLTKRLSKKVNFRYFTPKELREIGPEDTDTPEDEKAESETPG